MVTDLPYGFEADIPESQEKHTALWQPQSISHDNGDDYADDWTFHQHNVAHEPLWKMQFCRPQKGGKHFGLRKISVGQVGYADKKQVAFYIHNSKLTWNNLTNWDEHPSKFSYQRHIIGSREGLPDQGG